MLKQAGFTLLEMLLVLLLSSIVLLAVTQFIALLQQRMWQQYQQIHLYSVLNQGLRTIAKDLRRAGFCRDHVTLPAAVAVNVAHNCIVLHYDLDHRGCQSTSGQLRAEDNFAYRFRQQNIEYRRGETGCDGSNWERMFDQNEVVIEQFRIEPIKQSWQLSIAGHSLNYPSLSTTLRWMVKSENLHSTTRF